MAAKSRSITNPIPWSLLLKPFAVAAAWLVLPWWGFLLVALYCYLVPLFRPLSLAAAFVTFLAIGLETEPGFLQALYAAIVFALILGIKDFVIVDRKGAYELLVFLLSFAGCLLIFGTFATWSAPISFFSLALGSLLWFWLVRSTPDRVTDTSLTPGLAGLIFFEVGAVVLFLPLSFFSQTAILFSASVLLFEAALNLQDFRPRQLVIWGTGYAILALLVTLSASWKV